MYIQPKYSKFCSPVLLCHIILRTLRALWMQVHGSYPAIKATLGLFSNSPWMTNNVAKVSNSIKMPREEVLCRTFLLPRPKRKRSNRYLSFYEIWCYKLGSNVPLAINLLQITMQVKFPC